MKKYLFIIALIISLKGYSQTGIQLDKNSIVKDEGGFVLPYATWQAFVQSGDYSVRPSATGAKDFQLYKLTAGQKAAMEQRLNVQVARLARPKASPSFREGDKFRVDKFRDINGNKFDLKSESKIYVLNFWFINCPPCGEEIPALNQVVKKYADNKEVVFIAVALDDKYDIQNFLKTKPFMYNIVSGGEYYADKYGVTAYPTHAIIGKDGLIKFSTNGLAPNTVYWIEKTIAEQLAAI